MTNRDMVLWDGACGFCRRGIRWFEARDARQRLEMVPYQEAPSPPMTPELYEDCARAMYVVKQDGTKLRAGRALLYMMQHCGYPRLGRTLAVPPLVWLVELGYAVMARNRYVISRFLFTREPGSDGHEPSSSRPG